MRTFRTRPPRFFNSIPESKFAHHSPSIVENLPNFFAQNAASEALKPLPIAYSNEHRVSNINGFQAKTPSTATTNFAFSFNDIANFFIFLLRSLRRGKLMMYIASPKRGNELITMHYCLFVCTSICLGKVFIVCYNVACKFRLMLFLHIFEVYFSSCLSSSGFIDWYIKLNQI